MKYLGKLKSNRGHHQEDYLFRVSELELKVLKKYLLHGPAIFRNTYKNPINPSSQKNREKGASVSVRKCIGNIKITPK